MGDLVAAAAGFTLVVTLGCAALVALAVAPVFVASQLADVRGFPPLRWALLSAGAVLLGLGGAAVLHAHKGVPVPLAALPLLLCWAAPGVLWLTEAGQSRLGGARGAHQA